MIKKLLLLLLMSLLLVASVNAALTDNLLQYYALNNDYADEKGGADVTDNSVTFVAGILGQASNYSANADYLVTPAALASYTDFSVSLWVKYSSAVEAANGVIIGTPVTFNDPSVARTTDEVFQVYTDGVSLGIGTADLANTGWHHVVLTYDGTRGVLFVDGAVDLNASYIGSNANQPLFFGDNSAGSDTFLGVIDEIGIWDRHLTQAEVTELYNGGVGLAYPFAPLVVSNSSTESTAFIEQVGSVSFVGTTTILSGSFNVSVNSTPLYGAYSFNVESNNNNNMFCELLIDGSSMANVSRSQLSGVLGSVFIQTDTFLIDEGTHTQSLECGRSSGVGLITVSNAVGVGHFLVDEFNNTLAYNTTNVSNEVVVSGSAFTLIDTFNITVGNQTPVDNLTHHLVIEGALTYTNNDASVENLTSYLSINNSNCSFYPRTVNAGNTGSVAMDCILENVTANQTYTIRLYGNGTNSVYDGSFTVKELFLDTKEILGGSTNVVGLSFVGDTDIRIFNISQSGNFNHPVANAVNKISFSVLTNDSTTVTFYTRLVNGTNFTSINFTRDYEAGVVGVITGQDIFENVPFDVTYEAELWANCGTAGVNCTIVGGSAVSYITDVTSVITHAFSVSAFDSWDNNSIVNFNVSNGATFSSVNGTANVVSTEVFENVTVSSVDYFSAVILNHNTSNDLNVSLNQSIISFEAFEVFTNNSISGVTFEVTDGVITVNTSSVLNLKAGSYNVSTYKAGFYKVTVPFVVSALDNKSVFVEGLYTSNVTIVPRTIISNVSLSGLNISVYYGSLHQDFVNVSNASLSLVFGTNYTLIIDGVNISEYNESFSPSATGDTIEYIYVYSYNSLWIYAIDQVTGANISSFNVTVQNDLNQYTNVTVSNVSIIDNILSGVYTVIVVASGYVTNEYTITIDENAHQDLFAYLTNTSSIVSFVVSDSSTNNLIENVLITQKKFIGGILTTVSSALSDIVGEVSFGYDADVIYTFVASRTNYSTKTFTLAPSAPVYSLLLDPLVSLNPAVYVDDVSVIIYDSNIKNVVAAEIRIGFTSGGSLTDYFVNMSFDGSFDYVSGSSATGSVLTATLNLVNASLGDIVVVDYGYKSSVNADYVLYTKIYTIDSWSYVDNSFENARDFFDNYGFLEKAIIGTILSLFIAGIFIAGAGLSNINMMIGASMGGILGFGLATWFGLFNTAIFTVVAFVFGMIIITNLRGKS